MEVAVMHSKNIKRDIHRGYSFAEGITPFPTKRELLAQFPGCLPVYVPQAKGWLPREIGLRVLSVGEGGDFREALTRALVNAPDSILDIFENLWAFECVVLEHDLQGRPIVRHSHLTKHLTKSNSTVLPIGAEL